MKIKLMRLERLIRLIALKYYLLNTRCRAEKWPNEHVSFSQVKLWKKHYFNTYHHLTRAPCFEFMQTSLLNASIYPIHLINAARLLAQCTPYINKICTYCHLRLRWRTSLVVTWSLLIRSSRITECYCETQTMNVK